MAGSPVEMIIPLPDYLAQSYCPSKIWLLHCHPIQGKVGNMWDSIVRHKRAKGADMHKRSNNNTTFPLHRIHGPPPPLCFTFDLEECLPPTSSLALRRETDTLNQPRIIVGIRRRL